MARKYLGCNECANTKNCTIVIAGTAEDVLDLAVLHGIVSHGYGDPFELRMRLRSLLRDAPDL